MCSPHMFGTSFRSDFRRHPTNNFSANSPTQTHQLLAQRCNNLKAPSLPSSRHPASHTFSTKTNSIFLIYRLVYRPSRNCKDDNVKSRKTCCGRRQTIHPVCLTKECCSFYEGDYFQYAAFS